MKKLVILILAVIFSGGIARIYIDKMSPVKKELNFETHNNYGYA